MDTMEIITKQGRYKCKISKDMQYIETNGERELKEIGKLINIFFHGIKVH